MEANRHSPVAEFPPTSRVLFRSAHRCALALATTAILASFLLASCAPAKPTDPVSVVQAATDCLNEGDIDGYMGFLADDAVALVTGTRYEGSQAIRALLERDIALSGGVRSELANVRVDGNVVTSTVNIYEGGALVATYDNYVDVVVDGKIIFDGSEGDLVVECSSDPSQAFCPGD